MSEDQDEYKSSKDENRPPADAAWNHESTMYNTTNSNPATFYNGNLNAPLRSLCKNRESRDKKEQADKTKDYQKAQAKKIETKPEDHFDSESETIEAKVIALLEESYEGNIKTSIEKFERIKQDFITALTPSGKKRFQNCLRVGVLYYRGHMNEDSREWLKKAEQSSRELPLEDNEKHFKILHSTLGDILIKTKEYGEAKKHLEKAWDILEKMDPPDKKFMSWNRANMGQLLTEGPVKDYEQAENMLKESLELKKELENYRLIGLGYDYLADFYIEMGNYDKAMECVEEALKNTMKFRKGYYLEARHLRNRGRIHHHNAMIKNARDDYSDALGILEEELSKGNALSKQYQQEYYGLFGEIWKSQES